MPPAEYFHICQRLHKCHIPIKYASSCVQQLSLTFTSLIHIILKNHLKDNWRTLVIFKNIQVKYTHITNYLILSTCFSVFDIYILQFMVVKTKFSMNKSPIPGLDPCSKGRSYKCIHKGQNPRPNCNQEKVYGKRVTSEGKATVKECESDKWGKLYVVGIMCIFFSFQLIAWDQRISFLGQEHFALLFL